MKKTMAEIEENTSQNKNLDIGLIHECKSSPYVAFHHNAPLQI